jgi:predicted nucleic acid-binding protein
VIYLVDANVLSEPTKPEPDAKVIAWLRAHEKEIVIDPIILGELRFGILLLPAGKRRNRLEAWFEAGISRIACLPWESDAGMRWAELLAKLRSEGRSMPLKDSLIAATALLHDFTVVTRNTSDFASAGVKTLDPFR